MRETKNIKEKERERERGRHTMHVVCGCMCVRVCMPVCSSLINIISVPRVLDCNLRLMLSKTESAVYNRKLVALDIRLFSVASNSVA